MNLYRCRKRLRLALALGVVCLLTPSTGRAVLLPVNFPSNGPFISGSNGSLKFDAATGDFNSTLTGSSLAYTAAFVKPNGFTTFSGSLSIDLMVNQKGNFVGNGTGLQLNGTVKINGATFGGNNNPLLTGTITNFGSDAAGPPSRSFDGYFTITGGALTQTQNGNGGKPVFGGFTLGGPGAFLLSAENVTKGTLGDFSRDFSSNSVKPGIGPLVPEPTSLTLWLTTGVVMGAWGLRRRRFRAHAAG